MESLVKKDALEKFDSLRVKVREVVESAKKIIVNSEESAQEAKDLGIALNKLLKNSDALRKKLKAPHFEAGKMIDGCHKSVKEDVTPGTDHLRSQLVDWQKICDEINRKALEEAEAERKRLEEQERKKREAIAAKKEKEEFASLFGSGDSVESKKEIISEEVQLERETKALVKDHKKAVKEIEQNKVSNVRRPWKFSVIDESKVPREFLTLDLKAIREKIKNGEREIPGLKIYQDVQVAL